VEEKEFKKVNSETLGVFRGATPGKDREDAEQARLKKVDDAKRKKERTTAELKAAAEEAARSLASQEKGEEEETKLHKEYDEAFPTILFCFFSSQQRF